MKKTQKTKKRLLIITATLILSLAVIGAVSAEDGTADNSQTENLEQITNNSTTNSSQLPDPTLIPYGGGSPTHYTTIQAAYNAASVGTNTQMDTIELEENGVFTLSDFTISKNLIFTVANGGTATIQGSNNRLIYIASGYTVYFYNITFQNGHASDGTTLHPDGYNGGAIYNEGTLYLTNCTLRNNQAGDGGAWDYGGIGGNGGAIYNTGTTTINDCEIYNNRAGDGTDGNAGTHSNGYHGGHGGAIYSSGTLTIINSELYNNRAGNGGDGVILGDGGDGGNGGAIYNTATMTLTNTKIHDNLAGNAGAGGYQVLIGGTGGTGGNGGGIYNTGTTTITSSEINSNIAGNGGSGANGSDGLFSNGYAGHDGGAGGSGGAIYNTGHLEISNTEITNNVAGTGGNGGNGGNSGELGTVPYTGGTGGQGGAGGNGGGIFNSNYLLITESTVTSNRSGNGGNGGTGGQGSDRWRYYVPFHWVYVPSGNGGNGGTGGSSGSGAGIYHSGTYLEITSNNLTNNIIGTPGNGGAGGLQGSGDGGVNGTAGTAGTAGFGGAFYSTVNVPNPQGLHFNRILNNGLYDVASSGVDVDAINNWWGSNDNPSGRVTANVDANPWLVLRITANPTSLYYGENSAINATLNQNSDNDPVSGHVPNGIPVEFSKTWGTINPETTTTSAGQAISTYTANGAIPLPLTATITAHVDSEYESVSLNILKIPTNIIVDPAQNFAGQNVTLRANVTDYYGNPITVGQVTFIVNGEQPVTVNVDSSGIAEIEWTIPLSWNAGTYTNAINATYLGTDIYQSITGFNNLIVDKTPTNILVDPAQNFAGQNVTLRANVTDYYGNPITVGQVTFIVNGEQPVTVNVDSFGIAQTTWQIPASWNAGTYINAINATFLETANYLSVTGFNNLTVDKTPTNLVVSNITGNKGKNVNLTATLTDYYGHPLSEKTVTFKVNGVDVPATATTDALGVATLTYPVDLVGGNYTIEAVFAGDDNYLASNGNGTLKVPQSSIYVTITPSKTNPTVGEIITLTFKLGNKGPDTAENVVFTYVIPEGMEFVGFTGNSDPVYSYDPATRTITWNLGNVTLVDPWLYVNVKFLRSGSFIIKPTVTTDTYDPTLNEDIQSININVVEPANAASNTIPMQNTGIPIVALVLAVLLVGLGFVSKK